MSRYIIKATQKGVTDESAVIGVDKPLNTLFLHAFIKDEEDELSDDEQMIYDDVVAKPNTMFYKYSESEFSPTLRRMLKAEKHVEHLIYDVPVTADELWLGGSAGAHPITKDGLTGMIEKANMLGYTLDIPDYAMRAIEGELATGASE